MHRRTAALKEEEDGSSDHLYLGCNGLIRRGLVVAKGGSLHWGEVAGHRHIEDITRINQANHLLGG